MKPLLLAGIALVAYTETGVAAAASAPDVHYVYAFVTDGLTWKGNEVDNGTPVGDYTDLATSYTVAGRASGSDNFGGRAIASASLTSGTIRLSAAPLLPTHAVINLGGGGAFAQAGIGARIFLTGPASVAGKVQITAHVLGAFTDPDTYGNGQSPADYNSSVYITVEQAATVLAFGAGLEFVGPVSDMIYVANNGTTDQLSCNRCRMPTGAPVPTDVTTTIPFVAGQTYVDFAADMLAEGDGAATVSVRTVSFSIRLPPGFTYTSTMKFSDH